jgi:hypothetical protein
MRYLPVLVSWQTSRNGRLGPIVAEANETSVLDRDVRLVDFSTEDVNDAGICEHQFGALFTARD